MEMVVVCRIGERPKHGGEDSASAAVELFQEFELGRLRARFLPRRSSSLDTSVRRLSEGGRDGPAFQRY